MVMFRESPYLRTPVFRWPMQIKRPTLILAVPILAVWVAQSAPNTILLIAWVRGSIWNRLNNKWTRPISWSEMVWLSLNRLLMGLCSWAQPVRVRLLQFHKRPRTTSEAPTGHSEVTIHSSSQSKVQATPTDPTASLVPILTNVPLTQVTIFHLVISILITHRLPKENSLILVTVLVQLTNRTRV